MADERWLTDTEDRAWRGLRRVHLLTFAAIARDLQTDSGLSDADYEVLSGLSESGDDRCRFRDLARAVRWSTSRLAHHLGRMEQRELIERQPDEHDARGSQVTLTRGGRRTIEAAAPGHVRSVRRHLFDRLTDEQTDQLADIVAAILTPPSNDDAEP